MRLLMKKSILVTLSMLLIITGCAKNDQGKIRAAGVIDGDIIEIKSMINGKINNINFVEGQDVNKGDTLVKINCEKILNNLEELRIQEQEIEINKQRLKEKLKLSKARIDYLEIQTARFQRLNKDAAVSGEKFESMKLKLLEAKTTKYDITKQLSVLKLTQKKIQNKNRYFTLLLEDHVLISPISGIVLESYNIVGETIFPRDNLADILDINSLFVEVFLEEGEMSKLVINQTVNIFIDGLENQEIQGKIIKFGKKAEFSPKYIVSEQERKSLLYPVKIQLSKKNIDVLKVGMPVTVEF